MLKELTTLFAIAITVSLPATAQRRRATRTPAVPVAEQVQTALNAYDFELAEQLLTKEIAAQKRKRQPTEKLEQQLHIAQQGIIKLRATERICIIDSLVCDKADALRAVKLSHESGRIDTYASTYHTNKPSEATIYENELANKRYLAITGSARYDDADNADSVRQEKLQLAFSDKLGDSWSEPTTLTGLNDDDMSQNYPFLLADGVTLYYAATGPESLGGYDIFVSRADGEDGTFLTPENVGFPYNSTANDYMLAIDEYNQLGWFISDRNQPEGKACVYTFIPNSTRQTYSEDIDDVTLRGHARIASIRNTWTDETKAAQEKLAQVRNGQDQTKQMKPDFVFPINDERTYYSLDDFKSPEARKKMQAWLQLQKTFDTDDTMLQRLRDKYATAKTDERNDIATTIRRIEASHYIHYEELQQLAKDIRKAELTQ